MSSPASRPIWSLHPQLARDTAPVGDLALTRVLAMNDANYPWVILVPRRADVVEIIDLDAAERGQLMAEIAQVSAALKGLDRMRQAQCRGDRKRRAAAPRHVVARRTSDAAWPKPVWGAAPA